MVATAAEAGAPIRPDQNLTPGVVDPGVTVAMVCQKGGYTNRPGVRHVTEATKREVMAEYGYDPSWGPVEIDHRLPLILGGSNDAQNLWPETRARVDYSAWTKDQLEVHVWHSLCKGEISLPQAQAIFLGDWTAGISRYPDILLNVKPGA